MQNQEMKTKGFSVLDNSLKHTPCNTIIYYDFKNNEKAK